MAGKLNYKKNTKEAAYFKSMAPSELKMDLDFDAKKRHKAFLLSQNL